MNNILSEIKPNEKLEWKEFVKKYEKVARKVALKKLGFWRYHFTDEGMLSDFIILNSAWTDMKKEEKQG